MAHSRTLAFKAQTKAVFKQRKPDLVDELPHCWKQRSVKLLVASIRTCQQSGHPARDSGLVQARCNLNRYASLSSTRPRAAHPASSFPNQDHSGKGVVA